MPLPPPLAPRAPLHHRRIDCQGFERSDGLWDIEGRLIDTKAYSFPNHDRGTIHAGDPVHDLSLRLTIDVGLTIHAAEAVIDASPFCGCPDIASAYGALVGLTIGPGFRAEARRRLGGRAGCTHLTELLGPLATTAFQTLHRAREERQDAAQGQISALIDSCHALRADGPVVAREWPDRAPAPDTPRTQRSV
ncbi:DUF2889 domain-containing protein [Pararhodospirillum photometricum]|uniref:DUF2889 domain-containing protein n=1 Tax=Pararhodospirillum photometricum DSM 122 TaxID=1150469 RepID=H6SJ38_PARPM|nr:DUF2889 domain-containing protein [Pararhodospirillum photometricum]CCG08003.1 Putative uncharacterized protein [Pararhodospirillum photometricum DSM 122]